MSEQIKSIYEAPKFPIDAVRFQQYPAWIWQEWWVLLLPWRTRVVLWNWIFDAEVDWRKGRDPFMVQWLTNYWPFQSRWLPESLHWRIWKYCSSERHGKAS